MIKRPTRGSCAGSIALVAGASQWGDAMSKGSKHLFSPLVGVEGSALAAVGGLERSIDPLGIGKLQRELQANAERLDPLGYGKLHRSMAARVSNLAGFSAVTEHLAAAAAVRPTIDAMSAIGPLLTAGSQMAGLQRAVQAQLGGAGLAGLDSLRHGVRGLLGDSEMLASIDSFTRVRDQIGMSLGKDMATRWDRFAAPTVLPSIASLACEAFTRPTAVMSLLETDDLLGSISWLTPPTSENGPPTLSVVALHGRAPDASKPWRKLKIDASAAVNCAQCGTPFELALDIWLTGADEAFYQGEMFAATCSNCSNEGDFVADFSGRPPLRMLNGERIGPPNPIGQVFLIVNNEKTDGDDDEV